jgi:restriction system protein
MEVDPPKVVQVVRANDKKAGKGKEREGVASPEIPEEGEEWKQKLHRILTQKLAPAAFERLVQRVLRESGFIQVEVTGRTGDGGIDGRGIARFTVS